VRKVAGTAPLVQHKAAAAPTDIFSAVDLV